VGKLKGKGEKKVTMIDVLCIYVWKLNNKACWNCSKKGWRGAEGEWWRMVNLTKIHCKHVCKCDNEILCTANICYF
jgi:hypothetical protein